MIGDSEADILSGKEAGVTVVRVNRKTGEGGEREERGQIEFETIEQLRRWLDKIT